MFVSFKHIFCSILITKRILHPGFKDQMKGRDRSKSTFPKTIK